jgi:hypothetical protein
MDAVEARGRFQNDRERLGAAMGTAYRCGILVSVFVLSCARAVVSQPSADGERFTSREAGLAFDLPRGLRAQERRLFVDQGKDQGANLTVIDLVPAAARPGASAPLVTITVKDVLEKPSLPALASETVTGCEPMAFADTSARVGGEAALRRESPAVLQFLVARDQKTYRLSAGADAGARQALDRLAASLRFTGSDEKVVQDSGPRGALAGWRW